MALSESAAIAEIRRKSRTTSDVATDAICRIKINEAQKEFANHVDGLIKEDYLQVSPLFDVETHFAIRFTQVSDTEAVSATDVAICATAAVDQTGTQVATALQTALIAAGATSLTVAWDTATWTFTITATSDATSVTLAEPTSKAYASALELLGFVADTTTGDSDITITSSVPEDCSVEVSLPSDFVSLVADPEWDGERLKLMPWSYAISPETGTGDPGYYSILDNRLRLIPPPAKNKLLHIWFNYIPADVSDTVTDIQIDEEWAWAIVYHVAASLAEDNREYDIADRCWAQYKRKINEFIAVKANLNPKYEIKARRDYQLGTVDFGN